MDLGWFGCVCCPAAWELLRAGSTCPCQNMHRDIIPCNSLLRQKGVEKSCWLEKWMLSMAFHNAVWLISMVKIRQLFPSYTGMTKATIWQTEWAVMAVNYVQSHWSCWIVLSPNLRAVCKRLQRTLLGQLAMCVNDATTRLRTGGPSKTKETRTSWTYCLATVCKHLQRTLLGQLAMCLSDATTRLCEFWTCGSFNSASTWLIEIPALLNSLKNKNDQWNFSSHGLVLTVLSKQRDVPVPKFTLAFLREYGQDWRDKDEYCSWNGLPQDASGAHEATFQTCRWQPTLKLH